MGDVEQTLLRWQETARRRWSWLLDSRIGALVAESRPWFWPVGWVPAYVGTVVANHSLVLVPRSVHVWLGGSGPLKPAEPGGK